MIRRKREHAEARVRPLDADVDWSHEWETAWKPHVANVWFAYQCDVYAAWWRTRLGDTESTDTPSRVLKTDAFEEACGLPTLTRTFTADHTLMDVSLVILGQATRAQRHDPPGPLACVTDVRQLAFRSEAFDVVFSPSTLDHFSDARQIELAFDELRRVLRPAGRLLVALDNPSNPFLWVRQALYRRTGRVGGLIPFCMGHTLSRRQLTRALERAGFQVLESRYLLHTPRVIGLWLGEWTARADLPRVRSALAAVYGALERLLARLPTRRWTGHFVAVDCCRPPRSKGVDYTRTTP